MSVVALEVAIFIINNNVIQKVNRTFYCVWKFKMWLPWGASVTGNESEHGVIADRIYLQCKIVIHKYIDTDTVNSAQMEQSQQLPYDDRTCTTQFMIERIDFIHLNHMLSELAVHESWQCTFAVITDQGFCATRTAMQTRSATPPSTTQRCTSSAGATRRSSSPIRYGYVLPISHSTTCRHLCYARFCNQTSNVDSLHCYKISGENCVVFYLEQAMLGTLLTWQLMVKHWGERVLSGGTRQSVQPAPVCNCNAYSARRSFPLMSEQVWNMECIRLTVTFCLVKSWFRF